MARIGIMNIFSPGHGDTIEFEEEWFEISSCRVNGTKTSFARYVPDNGIDSKPAIGRFRRRYDQRQLPVDRPGQGCCPPVYARIQEHGIQDCRPVGDYVSTFALKGLEQSRSFFLQLYLELRIQRLAGKKDGKRNWPPSPSVRRRTSF